MRSAVACAAVEVIFDAWCAASHGQWFAWWTAPPSRVPWRAPDATGPGGVAEAMAAIRATKGFRAIVLRMPSELAELASDAEIAEAAARVRWRTPRPRQRGRSPDLLARILPRAMAGIICEAGAREAWKAKDTSW
jgi:hypothetical protein